MILLDTFKKEKEMTEKLTCKTCEFFVVETEEVENGDSCWVDPEGPFIALSDQPGCRFHTGRKVDSSDEVAKEFLTMIKDLVKNYG